MMDEARVEERLARLEREVFADKRPEEKVKKLSDKIRATHTSEESASIALKHFEEIVNNQDVFIDYSKYIDKEALLKAMRESV